VAYCYDRTHIRIAARTADDTANDTANDTAIRLRSEREGQVNPVDTAPVEARYQRTPRLSRRARVAFGAAGVLALTGVVAWIGIGQASPKLTATVLGYQVTSDRSVDVRFQVDEASAAKPAVCTLRARASSGEEVGRLDVPVPAGEKRQVLTVTVKTSGKAINGDVLECRLG
jgi:hypothetical protein